MRSFVVDKQNYAYMASFKASFFQKYNIFSLELFFYHDMKLCYRMTKICSITTIRSINFVVT